MTALVCPICKRLITFRKSGIGVIDRCGRIICGNCGIEIRNMLKKEGENK